jgi:hypothetical protein
MTQDPRQMIEQVIAYCSQKWTAAYQGPAGAVSPPDELTGEKNAYKDVFHYARIPLRTNP